jgi:hypothetical protein
MRAWHLGAPRRCNTDSVLVISDEAFARPTGVTLRVASAGGVYLFRALRLYLGGLSYHVVRIVG